MSEKKKILLVEDEVLISMMEKTELESIGYCVETVSSGEEAVEYINTHFEKTDLILMDIDLGDGIDGTEAARQILSCHDIPVVFLSSHTEPEIVEKTEKITSYGYVVKNSPLTVLDASTKMAFKLFAEKQKNIEKEAELEHILEATTDGIWSWDFTTNTLFFSDNYYRMLGYEPGEFPANYESWASLIHPDDLESALKTAREYLETKPDNYKNSFRLRKKDGSYISVICTAKVMKRDDFGNALYMIGNHTDVTETKKIKIELQKQSDNYYRLFNEHSAVKLLIDPENGKIVDANKSAVKYYGYSKEELQNMTIQQINCLSPEEVKAEMQKARDHSKVYFEFKHKLANGEIRDVNVFSNNIVLDEKDLLHSIIFDVTEEKRLEKKYDWLSDSDIVKGLNNIELYNPAYEDITKLNTCRLILDNVGSEKLYEMAEDAMALLDTSLAVYESNGDYAFASFISSWCQVMDNASFKRCNISDTFKALHCGEWLCHENCWNQSAKEAMLSDRVTDIECVGGIHLYAVPIKANGEIIGCVNVGYGTPPQSEIELRKLSEKFQIDYEYLYNKSKDYKERPDYIIELGKKRAEHMALLIGEEVENALKSRQLEETVNKYENLIRNLNEGFIVANENGIITVANEALAEMLGYDSPEELIGVNMKEIYAFPEKRDAYMQNLFDQKVFKNFEFVFKTKNGKHLQTSCNIKLLYDENGKYIGNEGLVRDISEIEKLHDKLEKQNTIMKSILKVIPGSLNVVDMDFNLILSNKEQYLLNEEDRKNNQGHKCYSAFMHQNEPCSWCHIKEVFDTGKEYVVITDEDDPRTKATGRFWRIINKPLFDNENNMIGAIEYGSDVTDIKNAEKMAVRQLEENELLIKETHHRIKNNIAAISSLLKVQIAQESDLKAKPSLQDAVARVDSMGKLYEKLLLSSDYRSVSSKAYFDELVDAIVKIYDNKNAKIVKNIEDVIIDVKKVYSVGIIVNEFITNSMKYAFEDSERNIISIDFRKNQDKIGLKLSDNGSGLPENYSIEKGDTLGIMLMKMMAKQLKGEIAFENDNGFNLFLEFGI